MAVVRLEPHKSRRLAGRESPRICPVAAPANQDLRAILVIPSGECARDVFRTEQSVAKAVALGAMLGGVALQIGPELGAEGVARVDKSEQRLCVGRLRDLVAIFTVEYVPEAWPRRVVGEEHVVEREAGVLLEADDEDPLPMLGHEAAGVDHSPLDVIPQLVGERRPDDLKRPALVMVDEVLDVLEDERLRAVVLDNPRNVEKQRALSLACETMRASERVLLADAGE